MQILLNGERFKTEARSLGELCEGLGFGSAKVATAVNGSFVAAPARQEVQLAERDEVEIVAPRQGG